MIKNTRLLNALENALIAREKHSYFEAVKLVDALWAEGRVLGVLPPADPLDGIETDIRIARILKRCSSNLS